MNCPHIPEIGYSQFSKRIHEKSMARRIPLNGMIELTSRCNLKCIQCYCVHDTKKKELSFEEIRHITDEIVKEGCLWLCVTGGDPLLRSDFLDIYTYFKKKGLMVTLFTNGTLITTEIADYLQRWKPFVVEITLYGRTEKTYELVTGIPGSFARCINGIHLLLERKIPLKLKTTVISLNKHEIWEMKKYAEDLGVEFRFDPLINPRIDGSKNPCQLRISPEEVVKFDLGDEERVKAWREFINEVRDERPDSLFFCSGGLYSFMIDSYGELELCVLYRRPSYNLRQGTFKRGWNNLFPQLRSQKLNKDNKCWKCRYFPVCEQCPGWAQLEKDESDFPVEYLCQIAHLRAKTLYKGDLSNEKTLQETADRAG